MSVEELEKLRSQIVRRNKFSVFIFLGAFLVISILIRIYPTFNLFMIIILMFIVLVLGLIGSKEKRRFIEEYKKTFVVSTLNQTFKDIIYSPNQGLPEAIIKDTKMMKLGNRYKSNDYIKAKYKDVDFEVSDVIIQDVQRDSDGHEVVYTYFNGQWMIFEFNKTFKANVQVKTANYSYSKINNSLFDSNNYKKIELEDIEFNKSFDVYAQNEHDAFYILTAPIMEKLKLLAKNTDSLMLCFIGTKLHIAAQTNKDSFEPSINKKIDIKEIENSVNSDIIDITKFIDILELNNDIFKAQ